MNVDKNLAEIFGKWTIIVDTPFGEEDYVLEINSMGQIQELDGGDYLFGSIFHPKAKININNGTYLNKIFSCSFNIDFPIKCSVVMSGTVTGSNKMSGTISIDKYVTVSFKANKNVSI